MIPDPPNSEVTENQGADADLAPEAITRAAMTLDDAIATTPSGDRGSEAGPVDDTVPQAELADLSSQLAERGVDLGSLLTAMMAANSQTKPKPKPAADKDASGEDPAALLSKLAKSLGISPAELMKRLAPVLKEMLGGQAAKPRRKPKKSTTKPSAKPKPKKETTKPAAKPKPKPKTTSKPKKDAAKPAAKPKPKKETAKPAAKPKPKPKPKPKKTTSRAEPIAQ